MGDRDRRVGGTALAGVLVAGLLVRLVILGNTSTLDLKIEDEHQYVALATSLVRGHGFAWSTGEPTSLRPPLYPAFVAAVWRVTGEGRLQAIRAAQIVISLVTAWLVFVLGRRTHGVPVGVLAACVVWLYPTLIYLNFTILGETLFTFFLVAFVLLAVMLVQDRTLSAAAGCGLALGLGALTRSVLWPVPLVLCPLLLALLDVSWRRRLLLSGLVFAGYAVVVGPWAVRNTRLQGVTTIVDTMGGMNLRMGNYEYTPEERMWDAVSLEGEKNWVYALTQEPPGVLPPPDQFTEGHKDKWAQRKAVEYMLANPGTTLRRSAIKFSDFWGLERAFIAGLQQGIYRLPQWAAILAAVLILSTSAAVMILGGAGLWLARPQWRVHILLLLPIVVVTGIHAIVFGHSRYHVPLVPLVAIYAAALVRTGGPRDWLRRRPAVYGAGALAVVIVAGWLRQLIVVDGEHVRALWRALW